MRNRVCVLTSVHPPFDIRVFHKECKSLARAGYDVTLVATSTEDREVDGVHVRNVPASKSRVERLARTVWRVYRKALATNADIYHFHDPELIPIGLLLRAQGKAVIYDVHEDLPRCMPYKPYLPRWAGKSLARIVETVENSASRFFSGVAAATPGIASRFCAVNPRTVIVNNYPLMQELALLREVPWQSRDMIVAYVGASITVPRGANEMIEAMGVVPAELGARLEIAGDASPDLRERLSKQPGWSTVIDHGVVNRAGVADILSRARVGLVVLHPEPNYVASKPIKMFEYMAAGIPVISSDFPMWRKIVHGCECGICVNPLDARQIANAIEFVLTHPAEAEAMGRRGRQAMRERYNWDFEERKLLNLYKLLMPSAVPVAKRAVAAVKA